MSRPEYLDYTYDMFLSSISGEQSEATRFSDWLDAVEKDGLYAFETAREEAQGPVVSARRTDGTRLSLINLSSYNYLGYAHHPEVIDAAKAALDQYGLGACSSPVLAGTFGAHRALESELLKFVDLPGRDVALFSSGYAVNTGTISALMKRKHHIVVDKSVHMSILEGCQIARAKVHYFEHDDVEDLRRVLSTLSEARRILVCTEGVFSADGDTGNLKEIVPLAKSFGAQVLVDEAHSFGVAGPRGRGVAEEAGVLEDVDLLVTTFSKAFGGVGGALIARRDVARYVRWYARCRMFSCALDPAVAGGVAKAVALAGSDDGAARRIRVKKNAAFLRERLQGRVKIGATKSWIIPVIYGEETSTIPLFDFLQREGLDASVMEFPAVPVSEARIRCFVTSEHTEAQLAKAADIIIRAAEKFDFAQNARP